MNISVHPYHSKLDRETNLLTWFCHIVFSWIVIAGSLYSLAITFRYAQSHQFSVVSAILLISIFILVWILIGSRQHALSILGHDGAHGFISMHIKWNDFLTNLFAFWPLFMSLSRYRDFHFLHHYAVATPRDPELTLKKIDSPYFDLPIPGITFFTKMTIHDLFGFGAKNIFALFILHARPKNSVDVIGPLLWWSVIAVACYLSMKSFVFLYIIGFWIFSLHTSFWAIFRLRVWAEHMGTESTHIIKTTFFERFLIFPYNIWLHYEHHYDEPTSAPNLIKLREQNRTKYPTTERTFSELLNSYVSIRNIPSGTPLIPSNKT